MPILLFRHGQTDKNIGKLTADTPATELNADGIRQALEAGQLLRDYCLAHKIRRIQPIVSGHAQENGDVVPVTRTMQSAAYMLEPIRRVGNRDIIIKDVIPDPRIRDIKFKPKGTETGLERLFSDRRELAEETEHAVRSRARAFHVDYLVEEPPSDTLLFVLCHTTMARFLAAVHVEKSLEDVEDRILKLHNLQGLEFHPTGVFTIFEGYEAKRDGFASAHKAGPFNILRSLD